MVLAFAQLGSHSIYSILCLRLCVHVFPKLLDTETNKRKNEKAKGNNYFPALQINAFQMRTNIYFPLGVLQYQLATGLAEGWSREIFPSPAFKRTVNTRTAFQTQIYTLQQAREIDIQFFQSRCTVYLSPIAWSRIHQFLSIF